MKVCPHCKLKFDSQGFICPYCYKQPVFTNGFPSFAPESSKNFDCFPDKAHKELFLIEQTYFWFRSRNNLIQYLFEHYFPDAKTFCEIGTGTGNVIAALAAQNPNIKFTGSELYADALSYAASRINNIQFIQADVCNLPFEDEFDVIGAFDVLEHIKNDQFAIQNIFKALKPSGGFIITVPQHKWLWSASDDAAYHQRRYTSKEIKLKIEGAGFKIKRMASFITLLLPLMTLTRLKYHRHKSLSMQEFIKDINISHPLNGILKTFCDIDLFLTKKGCDLPFGGSLFCVAVKP